MPAQPASAGKDDNHQDIQKGLFESCRAVPRSPAGAASLNTFDACTASRGPVLSRNFYVLIVSHFRFRIANCALHSRRALVSLGASGLRNKKSTRIVLPFQSAIRNLFTPAPVSISLPPDRETISRHPSRSPAADSWQSCRAECSLRGYAACRFHR